MVFLTNSCTPGERGFYTRRGFTFAAPSSVARVMASTLAVPVEDMNSFLVDLHSFAVTGMKTVVVSSFSCLPDVVLLLLEVES